MSHNLRSQNTSHVSERVMLSEDEIDDEFPATVPLHNWEQSASRQRKHDIRVDNHHHRRNEYNRNTLHTPSTSERHHRYPIRSITPFISPSSQQTTTTTTTTNTSLSHYTPSSQRDRRGTTQSSYSSYSFTPASSSLSPESYSYSYSYSYSNESSPMSTESFGPYETPSNYTPLHVPSHNKKLHSRSSSALMQRPKSTSSSSSTFPLNSSSVPTSHSASQHSHRSHRHDKNARGRHKQSRRESSHTDHSSSNNNKDPRVGRRTYHREVHPLPLSFINENRRSPSRKEHQHQHNMYVHRTKFTHKPNTSSSRSASHTTSSAWSPTTTTTSNATQESAVRYTRNESALMQEGLLRQLRARATSTPVSSPMQGASLEKNSSTNIIVGDNNNKSNNTINQTREVDVHAEDVRTQATKPIMTSNAVPVQQTQKTQIPLLPIQETITGGKLAQKSVLVATPANKSNINSVDKDKTAEVKTGGAVRVRIHQARNIFNNNNDNNNNNSKNTTSSLFTFISIHTRNERSRTGIVHHSTNPIYNDEFIFHVDRPSEDALVCTLVAFDYHNKEHANNHGDSSNSSGRNAHGHARHTMKEGKKHKIAECVLSLEYLLYKVERMVWMPLIHHPGTTRAFAQGEVLISLYSEDYGLDTMPTLEDEDWFRHEAIVLLAKYIPARLHQLDWLVGRFVLFGEAGIKRIEALCTQSHQVQGQLPDQRQSQTAYNNSRSAKGVPFSITIKDVEGLVESDGRPAHLSSCYVIITSVEKKDNQNSDTNTSATRHTSSLVNESSLLQVSGANERRSFQMQTRTTRYHRRAIFNEKFECHVYNPHTDSVNVAVYHAGRKLGEAEIGLINLKNNTTRHVRLMLIHAAGTGDACVTGHVNVHIRSAHYASTKCVSELEESAIRERVLAFL